MSPGAWVPLTFCRSGSIMLPFLAPFPLPCNVSWEPLQIYYLHLHSAAGFAPKRETQTKRGIGNACQVQPQTIHPCACLCLHLTLYKVGIVSLILQKRKETIKCINNTPSYLFVSLVVLGLPLPPPVCGQAAKEGRPDPRRLTQCSFEGGTRHLV